MSKSITIPSDRGSRITVVINGMTYVYQAGATVTVPDEVAAAIANMLAMNPGGTRKTMLDEMLEGVSGDIDDVKEDISDIKDDIDDIKDDIDALDERVTALEEASEETEEETESGS